MLCSSCSSSLITINWKQWIINFNCVWRSVFIIPSERSFSLFTYTYTCVYVCLCVRVYLFIDIHVTYLYYYVICICNLISHHDSILILQYFLTYISSWIKYLKCVFFIRSNFYQLYELSDPIESSHFITVATISRMWCHPH